jgi:ABC-type sugar transport system ATPase subunit
VLRRSRSGLVGVDVTLADGPGPDGAAPHEAASATVGGGRTILEVRHLSKTFPGTKALDDVSLDIRAGEVHALVGHNGSGKSTLIKVLSGYHAPDPGAEVLLDGESIDIGQLGHGRHGEATRLSFVHQDLGLVLELDAVDNLALHGGFIRTRSGRISWRRQVRLTRELMAPFAIDLDLRQPLAKATPVERTVVAIAAALQGWDTGGGVLVLDEPTAVLPPGEVERLFKIVRDLRASGAGILYVSHRLDEIFNLADRVTVLRNGQKIATRQVGRGMDADLTKGQLVHLMLGVEMEPDYRAEVPDQVPSEPLLEVKGLAGHYLRDTSFTLHKGEVLGIAGLPDSGRDELPRVLTDQPGRATGGSIRMATVSAEWTDIGGWKAIHVALLPADRGREGIVGPMTVEENLSLAVLGAFGSALRLDRRKERRFAHGWIKRLGVKTTGADSPIQTLSGGNQQKVLFGRTLARSPQVLVLCEPTAGVDIGARHAIYDLVADQVRRGLSVIVASSDVGDLLALCTRVLVLHDGAVAQELEGKGLTEHRLVQAMEGVERETV